MQLFDSRAGGGGILRIANDPTQIETPAVSFCPFRYSAITKTESKDTCLFVCFLAILYSYREKSLEVVYRPDIQLLLKMQLLAFCLIRLGGPLQTRVVLPLLLQAHCRMMGIV